ncbi:hypothetical protein BDZ89DRAFT_1184084 [Hymenopellis radicata]|nr:hypothetical protein BDZ89DRAFT_1184084 [Hymenopellis radicata]
MVVLPSMVVAVNVPSSTNHSRLGLRLACCLLLSTMTFNGNGTGTSTNNTTIAVDSVTVVATTVESITIIVGSAGATATASWAAATALGATSNNSGTADSVSRSKVWKGFRFFKARDLNKGVHIHLSDYIILSKALCNSDHDYLINSYISTGVVVGVRGWWVVGDERRGMVPWRQLKVVLHYKDADVESSASVFIADLRSSDGP